MVHFLLTIVAFPFMNEIDELKEENMKSEEAFKARRHAERQNEQISLQLTQVQRRLRNEIQTKVCPMINYINSIIHKTTGVVISCVFLKLILWYS